jgi:hypothetical protein
MASTTSTRCKVAPVWAFAALFTVFPLKGQTRADFNGDGVEDLAIGIPLEDLVTAQGTMQDAGTLTVIYHGSSAPPAQLWCQGCRGLRGTPNRQDKFGSAIAVGDFDADGRDDLAIGVPGEDSSSGAVHVIYGTPSGLMASRSQLWSQNGNGTNDIKGYPEAGDLFGYSLAAADFNGDGRLDLAIGAPGEDSRSGAVHILYGSASGLVANGNQIWAQFLGLGGQYEVGDFFGASLAAANFGHSFHADLAVGVPCEEVSGRQFAGAVNIIYGSSAGLTATNNRLFSQGISGIADLAESGDQFGTSLAAANFGRGAYADLAVGVPYEDVGPDVDAGAVNVIYGSANGLTSSGNQFWTQDPLLGVSQPGDHFGHALSAANFGRSPEADLAIGIPYEQVGWVPRAGAVNVIYGSSLSGLTATGNQYWSQDSSGFPGNPQSNDRVGYALAAADLDGDGWLDLPIGAPGEDRGCGAVYVVYGGASGLSNSGIRAWAQFMEGIEGAHEQGDEFGRALPQSF